MFKKHNLKVGDRYFFLTIVRVGFIYKGQSSVEVLCDCGTQKIINRGNFTAGHSKSCGCKRKEMIGDITRTHGDSKHSKNSQYKRIYRIWWGMIERVTKNYKERDIRNYKDKGISVCEEWKTSYPTFKEWALNNGYDDKLTIDRINTEGNYEPSNCRWATMKEQNQNRRPFVLERDSKGRFRKSFKECVNE